MDNTDNIITETDTENMFPSIRPNLLPLQQIGGTFIPYRMLQREDVRTPFINTFLEMTTTSSSLTLLKERTVLQWLCGDTSFLLGPSYERNTKSKTKDNEQCKKMEDEWGQSMLAHIRPDLKKSGQWTTVVGERLNGELQLMLGQEYVKPRNIHGYQPDGETNHHIWEVKTQTYFTSGTAGEKILGVPFKYADVPLWYQKSLKIVCLGGAERDGRLQYGILPGGGGGSGDDTDEKNPMTENRQKILNFWHNELNIEYIGATDLMQQIVNQGLEMKM